MHLSDHVVCKNQPITHFGQKLTNDGTSPHAAFLWSFHLSTRHTCCCFYVDVSSLTWQHESDSNGMTQIWWLPTESLSDVDGGHSLGPELMVNWVLLCCFGDSEQGEWVTGEMSAVKLSVHNRPTTGVREDGCHGVRSAILSSFTGTGGLGFSPVNREDAQRSSFPLRCAVSLRWDGRGRLRLQEKASQEEKCPQTQAGKANSKGNVKVLCRTKVQPYNLCSRNLKLFIQSVLLWV